MALEDTAQRSVDTAMQSTALRAADTVAERLGTKVVDDNEGSQ